MRTNIIATYPIYNITYKLQLLYNKEANFQGISHLLKLLMRFTQTSHVSRLLSLKLKILSSNMNFCNVVFIYFC